MPDESILATFLEEIPAEYPRHMLCYFAQNAVWGNYLPFTRSLLDALESLDSSCPGYAQEMLHRIGGIRDLGEEQYEAILEILAEIYVSAGLREKADADGDKAHFNHEPSVLNGKNPEFEVRVAGQWCAVEVKAPRLIAHGRLRDSNSRQLGVRLPPGARDESGTTLPRDNPVKDFLESANAKFEAYEQYRAEAFRALVIIWDDFCNEPIAALTSPVSGLLTENSFNRNEDDAAVQYPYVDGIVVVRHQHQMIRATRGEPLVDGVAHVFAYHHPGFPPKAFIRVPGGREPSDQILEALNATPLNECLGAEYLPTEMVMWFGS